jgi:hypothetical protein
MSLGFAAKANEIRTLAHALEVVRVIGPFIGRRNAHFFQQLNGSGSAWVCVNQREEEWVSMVSVSCRPMV